MEHETMLTDVSEQHSIDRVLFGDNIDVPRLLTGLHHWGTSQPKTPWAI